MIISVSNGPSCPHYILLHRTWIDYQLTHNMLMNIISKVLYFPWTLEKWLFEKQNDVSVNVYFLKKKSEVYTVLPRHVTIQKKEKHVNLLLIESYYVDEDEEEESVKGFDDFDNFPHSFHYVWIKDLSRLVSSQFSARKSKTFLCDRYQHYFRTVEKLIIHTVDCEKMNQ